MSRASDGAFDITVQPLWAIFATAAKSGTLPTDEAVAAARAHIDWRNVHIDASQISLHGTGTAITLNGIAQGFATDRARAALLKHGIENALVSAGEIGTLGDKASGEPWRVGIQHPRLADAFISLAKLEGRSLATSGDYATSFTADHRTHHIFDPRSGRSPTQLASVSIAARSALIADALSTAVFVLGPDEGLKLVRDFDGADAFFVLKNGRTLVTDNFPLDA
jgi:thiamine biosynthesis lipoprotein